MTDFNPEKYGFFPSAAKESEKAPKEYIYETDDFVLTFYVTDKFLTILDTDDAVISEGKVPATNQSLALLLKAFAIQRPKT